MSEQPAFTFSAPAPLACEMFHLEVLTAVHNERDYEAWTTSMDHIHATHGFEDHEWPIPMTLEQNLADMEMHATEFQDQTGYTYSILDGDQVIGCLYIYPPKTPQDEHDALVRSWVRATRAQDDQAVRERIAAWLSQDWPFENPRY